MNKEMPPTKKIDPKDIPSKEIMNVFAQESNRGTTRNSVGNLIELKRSKKNNLDDYDLERETKKEKNGIDTQYAGRYGKFE